MTIRVAVSGSGSMGREVLAAVERADGIEPAGVIEKFASADEVALPSGGAVPMSADPAALLDQTKPDVVIDFTNAAWTPLVA